MKHIHCLICNIFVANDIYYRGYDECDEKPVIFNEPTKNEISFYFNILEIITKILSREYYSNSKKKFNSYSDVINDSDYLQSIEYIKDNI